VLLLLFEKLWIRQGKCVFCRSRNLKRKHVADHKKIANIAIDEMTSRQICQDADEKKNKLE
jgi:hypothetical protein